MSIMRPLLHRILSSQPEAYVQLLRLLKRGTPEKVAFLSIVRRGDTVFDVGANFGYFTAMACDLVGRGGTVHAFEAVPPTFEKLQANCSTPLKEGHLKLNGFACSDQPGTVEMTVPDGDFGQASMQQHSAGSWGNSGRRQSYTVKAERLETYIQSAHVEKLDFVKIDVEGAELLVLKGFGSELARLKPLLMLELSPLWTAAFDYEPADVLSFLRTTGYDSFVLLESPETNNPEAVLNSSNGPLASWNVVCGQTALHSGIVERLKRNLDCSGTSVR